MEWVLGMALLVAMVLGLWLLSSVAEGREAALFCLMLSCLYYLESSVGQLAHRGVAAVEGHDLNSVEAWQMLCRLPSLQLAFAGRKI